MQENEFTNLMTFDLKTNHEQINNSKGSSLKFLDYEINELLKYIRFTVNGQPVNVDGYILVSDQKTYCLKTIAGED